MKILWLSHLVPYPETGIGALQRSHNLLKQLASRHEVHLLSFIQPSLLENAFGTLSEGIQEATTALSKYCENVSFVEIASQNHRYGKPALALKCLFNRKPYSTEWLFSNKYREIAQEWSTNTQFDIAHYDTISLAEYRESTIAKKHVLNHHNIESHMMLRRSEQERNKLKKLYFGLEGRKLERYEVEHCKLFDLHLTCSDLDSMRLAAISPGSRIEEIPNGVDISYFKPGNKVGVQTQLVFAGSLDWYPNAEAMLYFAEKIWPIIKTRRPNIIMNVIGRKPPQQLVELSKMDCNFKTHGFVDDVRPYITNSDVYICPISDGGGTKLKILDAFAMGKAVVSHPIACEGIGAIDGQHVLYAQTPDEFADKVELVLNNHQLRNSLEKNARNLIESKYSYQQIGDKLASLYENLATS